MSQLIPHGLNRNTSSSAPGSVGVSQVMPANISDANLATDRLDVPSHRIVQVDRAVGPNGKDKI